MGEQTIAGEQTVDCAPLVEVAEGRCRRRITIVCDTLLAMLVIVALPFKAGIHSTQIHSSCKNNEQLYIHGKPLPEDVFYF